MNEEAACQQYLLDLLGADSTLTGLVYGVWFRSVPKTASFPAIKLDRQDSNDLMVVGLNRVWDDLSYLVRGIVHWRGGGQPDWTEVRAIGDRIDEVLHGHEGANAEIRVHSFREETFVDETLESGDVFIAVGGIYRVRAYAV